MIPTTEKFASDEVLNSWKEIASYLDRGVRTVQRWESELGLPVRRPRGKSRSAVIAIRSELDQWLRTCPVAALNESGVKTLRVDEPVNGNEPAIGSVLREQTGARLALSDLVVRSRLLGYQLNGSVKELRCNLDQLVANMQKVASAAARLLAEDPDNSSSAYANHLVD